MPMHIFKSFYASHGKFFPLHIRRLFDKHVFHFLDATFYRLTNRRFRHLDYNIHMGIVNGVIVITADKKQ